MIQATKYYQRIWSIFDWAMSVWPVVIITFVFPNYFINQVCQDPVMGEIYWADTITISGIIIAIFAPFIGSIADSLNNSTSWLRAFTFMNIICAYSLWFIKPGQYYIYPAMAIIILGIIAFEITQTFYNTYLTHITTSKSELSKISGFAWGLGYTAGIGCLLFCIMVLITPEKPLFGLLDTDKLEHIRIIGPLVGTWYLLFGIPLLLERLKPEDKTPISILGALRKTKTHIQQSIAKTKDKPYIYHYLIIRMIYTDGINTLFAFAGIYAANTFNMDFKTIMYFGVSCNIAAGFGCFFASWSDAKFGEPNTLQLSLSILFTTMIFLLRVKTIKYFWACSIVATFFVGPIQASSRSLMAKICPEDAEGEFFGLYALSGKVSSFLGPLLLRVVLKMTGSHKLSMGSINIFFLIGLIGLYMLKIPQECITTEPVKDA